MRDKFCASLICICRQCMFTVLILYVCLMLYRILFRFDSWSLFCGHTITPLSLAWVQWPVFPNEICTGQIWERASWQSVRNPTLPFFVSSLNIRVYRLPQIARNKYGDSACIIFYEHWSSLSRQIWFLHCWYVSQYYYFSVTEGFWLKNKFCRICSHRNVLLRRSTSQFTDSLVWEKSK